MPSSDTYSVDGDFQFRRSLKPERPTERQNSLGFDDTGPRRADESLPPWHLDLATPQAANGSPPLLITPVENPEYPTAPTQCQPVLRFTLSSPPPNLNAPHPGKRLSTMRDLGRHLLP